MPSWLESLLLGIIQGLTEFLPISSSGHIAIANYLFESASNGEGNLLMTVVLHFATAISTMYVFRKDIWEICQGLFSKTDMESRPFVFKIIVSMIPAVVVGLLLEEQIEEIFSGSILLVYVMLIVTGVLLFLADKALSTDRKVSLNNSFIIGIAQAIAILPGISRSGATIASSVLLGVDREKAARFSFLMVIPLIFGKMAKDFLSGDIYNSAVNYTDLLVGFVAAFLTGIFACRAMIKLVKNSKLKYFSFYCFLVAVVGIIFFFFNG